VFTWPNPTHRRHSAILKIIC